MKLTPEIEAKINKGKKILFLFSGNDENNQKFKIHINGDANNRKKKNQNLEYSGKSTLNKTTCTSHVHNSIGMNHSKSNNFIQIFYIFHFPPLRKNIFSNATDIIKNIYYKNMKNIFPKTNMPSATSYHHHLSSFHQIISKFMWKELFLALQYFFQYSCQLYRILFIISISSKCLPL